MWKSLYKAHGMQRVKHINLDEYVYGNFERLYARLEQGKKCIPPGQFHELHYEDLVQAPEEQLHALYDNLRLDGFEKLLPRLRELSEEYGRLQAQQLHARSCQGERDHTPLGRNHPSLRLPA